MHINDSSPATPATEKVPPVVLISGISGSGKSVALNALEDAGYFCVDNLPPELLHDFIRLERKFPSRRLAIAADVRTASSLPKLLPVIDALRREGTPVLGLPLMWVILPLVLLMAALVVRSAWAIWQALRGHGLESELRV